MMPYTDSVETMLRHALFVHIESNISGFFFILFPRGDPSCHLNSNKHSTVTRSPHLFNLPELKGNTLLLAPVLQESSFGGAFISVSVIDVYCDHLPPTCSHGRQHVCTSHLKLALSSQCLQHFGNHHRVHSSRERDCHLTEHAMSTATHAQRRYRGHISGFVFLQEGLDSFAKFEIQKIAFVSIERFKFEHFKSTASCGYCLTCLTA